jgi:hypothetical protein
MPELYIEKLLSKDIYNLDLKRNDDGSIEHDFNISTDFFNENENYAKSIYNENKIFKKSFSKAIRPVNETSKNYRP